MSFAANRNLHKPNILPTLMEKDRIMASFGDAIIYESDFRSVNSGEWLTDAVITFHIAVMGTAEKCNILDPAQVSLLCSLQRNSQMCTAYGISDSIGLCCSEWILAPVNSAMLNFERNALSGTHWSLLIISASKKCAWHCDSAGNTNSKVAAAVSECIGALIARKLNFVNLENCPQQTNNSDCGVFVCAFMEAFLNKLKEKKVSVNVAGAIHDFPREKYRNYREKLSETIKKHGVK